MTDQKENIYRSSYCKRKWGERCRAAIAHNGNANATSSDHNRGLFVSAYNDGKCVLNETKLLFTDRMKRHITPHKFWSKDYWQISKIVLNKYKSSIPPFFKLD